ncbi:MAG: diguanylate cyclase domain-containing protein, partial [Methyloceanibacter sp.]
MRNDHGKKGRQLSASSKELAPKGLVPPAQPQGAASIVDFGPSDAQAECGDASGPSEAPLDLEQVLASVRETAYRWDFANDRIDWAANAATVLGVADAEKISRGRAFALLVDPEQAGARYDGITGGPHVTPGTELRYCLRYRFLPEGRRGRAALWVEDTGVCSIDAEGRPSVAQGTLRVINDRREREERLLYLGSHDELTGQLNRTRLTEELSRFLGNAGRTPVKGAFLLAGVNDLTLVNETYGYDVGDEVITIVGRRIGRALR